MRTRILIAALFSIAAASATASATNLVSNPDFSSTNYNFPGYSNSPAGYNQVAGWTVVNGGATGFNTTGFWNNGTVPAGTNSVGFIQVDGSLSTVLTGLLTNQTYVLSFLDNARSLDGDNCCNASPTVNVTVGGVPVALPVVVNPVGGSNPFYSVTTTFVATGSTETLAFLANTAGVDGTALFTNVSVAATPEPSSLLMLGTGLAGFAGVARRKFFQS